MSEIKTLISNNILPVELRDIPTIMKGEKGERGRDGSYVQKAYKTYASMLADKANIPANTNVVVNNDPDKDKNAYYTYEGSEFTKSDFDPQGILTTVDVRLNQAVESASEYFQSQVATTVDTAIGNSTIAYNQAIEVTKGEWANTLSTTDAIIKDNSEAYLATIAGTVNDAINSTAVDGGVLADTFITVNNSINQRQVNMGFSDIAAIKAIVGANIGMRVYSKTYSSNFIFKETSTSPVNDGTVLQGVGGIWEMEDKDAYFASWFATPNVQADQALRLQAGYAYATSKGKSFVIDDTYWVDGKAQDCVLPNADRCALLILSNSVMHFTPKGHIKLLSNNYSGYHILIACNEVSNYIVNSPVLTGDRLTHDYTGDGDGEWGYGLTIYESSDGVITDPKISQTSGDGLYIGKAWTSTLTTVPKDITITNPIIYGARRNGLSFTAGDNVQVIRPVITKVGVADGIAGKYPMAAIDIEPENAKGAAQPYIRNCVIDSPALKDATSAILVYATYDNMEISLHFKGLTVLEGITTSAIGLFHGGANGKGRITVDHLHFKTVTHLPLNAEWNGTSNLFVEFKKLTTEYKGDMVFQVGVPANIVGKKLGNVAFRNINMLGDLVIVPATDTTYIADNLIVESEIGASTNVLTYVETSSINLGGKNTRLVGSEGDIHRGYSVISNQKPNIIWQDPSVSAVDDIFINTATDFRILRVGLHYKTKTIGKGCNISGLSIKHATGVHTKANCKTLGGWLEFQNVEGGNTRVINSYGVWTFS